MIYEFTASTHSLKKLFNKILQIILSLNVMAVLWLFFQAVSVFCMFTPIVFYIITWRKGKMRTIYR